MEPSHIPEINLHKADLVRGQTPDTGTSETVGTVCETII